MRKNLIEKYLNGLKKEFELGNSTEHSFRPILKSLIESLDECIIAINEPQRIKSGAPDFLIATNKLPIGYIETKKLGADLNKIEDSTQLTRYRRGIPNFILTNYTEFRWYSSGDLKQ